MPSSAGFLLHEQLRRTRNGALMILCLTLGGIGHGLSQPGDPACKNFQLQCQGSTKSSLCAQLQQRCGAPGGGGAYRQSPIDRPQGMPLLDNPLSMPDCAPGEELTMVPTCQCGSPSELGGKAPDDDPCATCTSDGTRMVCQRV